MSKPKDHCVQKGKYVRSFFTSAVNTTWVWAKWNVVHTHMEHYAVNLSKNWECALVLEMRQTGKKVRKDIFVSLVKMSVRWNDTHLLRVKINSFKKNNCFLYLNFKCCSSAHSSSLPPLHLWEGAPPTNVPWPWDITSLQDKAHTLPLRSKEAVLYNICARGHGPVYICSLVGGSVSGSS